MTTLVTKVNDALANAATLRSKQSARVVDLLSEGEIHGLVNGLQSVYLNETPVMNADGSLNFNGVTLEGRNGTPTQSYIPGFPSVESENPVGVQVKQTQPVVRTITNANANGLRVTITLPSLQQQDMSTGEMKAFSVSFAIDVQTAGGGFVEKVNDTITGRSPSRYQQAYLIQLAGAGPWDVRVRRISADNTLSTAANDLYWTTYTEIIDAKLRYPNSAIQAVSVSAEYFDSIPSRGYEAKGLLVQVPSNYNPENRTYTGSWNGTFVRAWTNNPAWCFYDLLTQNRYGLGKYLDVAQVDKWSLYQIARYCDELVSDGYGGFEPRYTCSLYLQTQEEAYNVLTSMASIFCGIAFWTGGAVMAVQDAPSAPAASFNPGNVVDGEFTYSGSSLKSRHTVALVSWNDPEDMYRQKIEYVEDREGVMRFGVRQTSVVAIGCTSRGQAHRFGRSMLYTERLETETISFKAGMDAVQVMPGEVIQTTDPVRAGVRMGGRLQQATASMLTLDAPVTLSPGNTYVMWVVLPSGVVESRAVSEGVGEFSVLHVAAPFSQVPQELAIWTLAASNLAPETWRVISIAEASDATGVLEVTALKYSSNKYAEIEQGLVLEALPTSNIKTRPDAPDDLLVVEGTYAVSPSALATRATLSWTGVAAYFEVMYRRAGGSWVTMSTSSTSVEIQPLQAGVYEFTVTAINAVGYRSRSVAATATIYGLDGPPDSVTGLHLNIADNGVYAFWDAPFGPSAYNWSSTELREGAAWASSMLKFRGKATTANIGWLPAGSRTVWAAHLDAAGQNSEPANVAIAILSPNQPIVTNQIWRNVVTLKWQDCRSSQPIATYRLRVGPVFATAVEFAQINGTVFERSELTSGAYTYWVVPVDVAGNQGAPGYVVVNLLPGIDEAIAELIEGLDETTDMIDQLENTFVNQWGVRVVDSGGKKVAGMILTATGEQTDFVVLSDRFAIAQNVAGTTRYPFVVGLINGVSSIGINGNMYIDGTVKARHLDADFITALNAQFARITANEGSINTLTAQVINVGVGKNLLQNSTFVGGTSGWTTFDEIGGLTAGRDTPDANWYPVGGHTLTMYQIGAAQTGTNKVAGWMSEGFPVEAEKRYEFSVYTGAHRCRVFAWLIFMDASGNGIRAFETTVNDAEMTGGKLLSGYKRVFGFATAPANTAYAHLQIRREATKAGQSDSWLMATQPMVAVAGAAQTAPSAYGPSGLGTKITPDGITTPSLSALSANMGEISSCRLDIQSNAAGDYGYARSYGKWWGDGVNGWVFARAPSGETFTELKAGAGRIWMASWGDFGIQFPGITMTASGLTITQVDAINSINIAGNAVSTSASASGTAATIFTSINVPAGETWKFLVTGTENAVQTFYGGTPPALGSHLVFAGLYAGGFTNYVYGDCVESWVTQGGGGSEGGGSELYYRYAPGTTLSQVFYVTGPVNQLVALQGAAGSNKTLSVFAAKR